MNPIKADIKGRNRTVACQHWQTWPPPYARIDTDIQQLRALKDIDAAEYQRYQVWEKHCGLLEMDMSKCLTCPHFRYLEVERGVPNLVSLDGQHRIPVVDIPTTMMIPKHRNHLVVTSRPPGSPHSGQDPEWLKAAQRRERAAKTDG